MKKTDQLIIKILLTADQILATESLFDKIDLQPTVDPKDLFNRSIFRDVSNKINDKAHVLKKSASLFDTLKKHKMDFKFHEAFMLHSLIFLHINNINHEKSKNDLRMIMNELTPKVL
jgi:hypothetical protein